MMTSIEPAEQRRKKGGRPPKAVKRNRIIALKCTLLEERIIRGKAKKAMLSVSEYLREMATQGKIMMRSRPLPREILALTGTLNHLAANLNQIAKQRNGFELLTLEERTNLKNQSQEVKALAVQIKSYLQ